MTIFEMSLFLGLLVLVCGLLLLCFYFFFRGRVALSDVGGS